MTMYTVYDRPFLPISHRLQRRVTTVNGELGAGGVLTGVRAEVDDGTLEVGWVGHSSHRDSVEPLVSKDGVGIEDDCRSALRRDYEVR